MGTISEDPLPDLETDLDQLKYFHFFKEGIEQVQRILKDIENDNISFLVSVLPSAPYEFEDVYTLETSGNQQLAPEK